MMRNAPMGKAAELDWFKSSYSSGAEADSCVEVATAPGTVHVRDSKNVEGPRFAVALTAWTDFLQLLG
ncbi:DUF397 domain-containing protein [Streptomyces sp. NPDC091279]|uniref:DUF397 domain-containing protein n=1 Tax=Streptomyces sp. NPDC091279 TaxID=3365983 RepID=UPI00381EE631